MRLLVLGTVLLAAGACGSAVRSDVAVDPPAHTPASPLSGPMPTAVPAAEGLVRTRGLVTVLDDGHGPELCLGPVETSYPPQCSGPHLRSWDWTEHHGVFEDRGGVRWGEFAMTGRFDGSAFMPTDVVPSALFDPKPDPSRVDLSTPCPAPAGGWRVIDPVRTTDDSLDAVTSLARRLPGYADLWLDQSRNPARGNEDGEGMNDPAYVTVDVRVTQDPEGAEAALRKVWGGALCVTRAVRTERELHRIQQRLTKLPGMLTASSGNDRVEVEVIHDDGSLQAWADATYGSGLVQISSALVPASG